MNDQEIRATVVEILKMMAPDAEFEGADVTFESDWDGEPVISVRARFAHAPEDPSLLLDAGHRVRSALLAKGEDRFVFLAADVADERHEEPEEVE